MVFQQEHLIIKDNFLALGQVKPQPPTGSAFSGLQQCYLRRSEKKGERKNFLVRLLDVPVGASKLDTEAELGVYRGVTAVE
jgi:hypothetical protein